MTVREAIEAALKLIPEDREAGYVDITWNEDGTYSLILRSESLKKAWELTHHGLEIVPCNQTGDIQ